MLSRREILDFIINNDVKEIANEAKALPMLIRINGLGNTVAYLLYKQNKESQKVYTLLSSIIIGYLNENELISGENKKINTMEDLLTHVQTLDSKEYMDLTNKVFQFAVELRNYARLYKESR